MRAPLFPSAQIALACLLALALSGCAGGNPPAEHPTATLAPAAPPPPGNNTAERAAAFAAHSGPASAAGRVNCNWRNSLCLVQECKSLLKTQARADGAAFADLSLQRPSDTQIEVKGMAVIRPAPPANALPFSCRKSDGGTMEITWSDAVSWSGYQAR